MLYLNSYQTVVASLSTVGNELGKCEGTRLLDLDNPNWEHVGGLGGPFPVFRSFSFFSLSSLFL